MAYRAPLPIKSLRDAVRAERLLWFFCRHCGHATRLDPRELARFHGDALLEALGRRAKCSRCTARGVVTVVPAEIGWPGRND